MGGIWYMELAGDVMYNTLNYAIVSRHQINTCTVLYSSVLYCIKIRKFAHKQTRNVSKTEVHSIPLWILSGYTRELANNCITLYYLPAHPDDPQGIRVASVIEFSVCVSVCVWWANFLISGRRHVIVACVTIKFAASMNLKTHYQTNCNECAKRFCGRHES